MDSIKNKYTRLTAVSTAVILIFIVFWSKLPVKDAEAYFGFADNRCLLGLNNFSDVISNLAFALVGLFGFNVVQKSELSAYRKKIGFFMSFSIFLVSIGSAYFHYLPNIERLFWDRLPMVFAFISVVSLIITDKVDESFGYKSFLGLLIVAVTALILWRLEYFDLRPYLLIQFGSLVFILLSVLVLPRGSFSNKPIWQAFVFYILAKIAEKHDADIYDWTSFISGHTLKHLLAAAAMFFLLSVFKTAKKN